MHEQTTPQSFYASIKILIPGINRMLVRALVFCLVLEAIKIVPPYLIKLIVDNLITPLPDLQIIYLLTGGIFLASFVNTGIELIYNKIYIKDVRKAEITLLKKAQKKLLELDLTFHEKHPSGELFHQLNKGAQQLVELLWFIHDQFMGATLQIILTSLVIMHENLIAGTIFLVFMPIVLVMLHRFGIKIQPYRKSYHKVFRESSWKLNQSLINVRTVKDYAQETKEAQNYGQGLDEYMRLSDLRNEYEFKDSAIRDVLLNFGRIAVISYVIYLVFKGSVSAGSLFLIATLSEKVIASLFRLGRLYNFLGDAVETIKELVDILLNQPKIKDQNSSSPLKIEAGEIEFKAVDFDYPNGTRALTSINFLAPAKKIIAIVGKSGSGKSSLVKLLFHHYDTTGGNILVDGQDIKKYSLKNLRKSLAIVSQDIEVFDLSIAENISYGVETSETEIIAAARLANAHEFIEKLPEQYATRIGERGIRLSGGQRQRLGIARALLTKPKILVFDEATSSLDSESEKLIQIALKNIAGQQTMLVIAHRLSTIKNADIVIVLDQGKIVESGPYTELAKNQGWFAKMVELQNIGQLRD